MNRGKPGRFACALAIALALALPCAVLAPWAAAHPQTGPRSHSASSALGQPALHVIPFPGTPDASPQSQIIFSSLRPSDIVSVLVTGSSSRMHPGHLSKLPDHAGTAFLPKQPFTPGETVTVQAVLSSPQAGTASGDRNATTLNFSFTVATPASTSGAVASEGGASATAQRANRALVTFHSRPGLHPPPVAATADPDDRSGKIFITAKGTGNGASQQGPVILNGQGKLLWFRNLPHRMAYDLQVQRYRSQRVLTWWQGAYVGPGPAPKPAARGQDVIVNQSYRTVGVVRGAESYYPDLHEFEITPRGTALVDSFSVVQADLTSVGGSSSGRVVDCLIQELDIRTGKLLWEWHALGHVPLTDSYAGSASSSAPYDFFHMNSIQELPHGNLLISSRNTWSIYEVDRQTGQIVWTLGGKHSSFHMGPATNFEWQHDARLSGHDLSLFDDASSPQEEPQSSAKLIRIDESKRTAVLLRRYNHSPPLLAPKGGSMQILPNGNVFVGWGGAPDFSEYTPGGRQVFNGSIPIYMNSYRAFRFPWTGTPRTPPALTVARSGNGISLYVSWNGATQVAGWRVLGGPTRHALRSLKTSSWRGFETAIALSGAPHYLAVQALDTHGHVLGRSNVLSRPA